MDAVRMGDTDLWATVEYRVPEFRGMPVRQQHLHAYFGRGDVCAEVHPSKVRVTAADQALFERALGAVRIREVPAVLSSVVGGWWPVGSGRRSRVGVRVVAATHRDLAAWARDGRFRDDLCFRLRRVVLRVPPLRARLEDLPLLVEHCRRRFNARHALAIEAVSKGAMLHFAAHPWPGNVRELEAVLEEAMIFRGRGQLGAADFLLEDIEAPSGGLIDRRAGGTDPDAPELSASRRAVALQLAKARGALTRRDLAAACGISREVARRDLTALVGLGLLRRVGRGRSTLYVRP